MEQEKGSRIEAGIADEQAKDFDFVKTEMKYDSTGMFHWTTARSIDECILVRLRDTYTTLTATKVFYRTVTKQL